MKSNFLVYGGSVPGTDHTMPGQPGWVNSHDAFAWKQGPGYTVAVVCDGCGGKFDDAGYLRAPNSEVGAKIAAQLLVERISRMAGWFSDLPDAAPLDEYFWDRVRVQVMTNIAALADSMGASLVSVVKDYFMFTFVGVLVTPRYTYVFSIGDGVYAINGRVHILGPYPGNSPPYLMYNLIGSTLTHHSPDLLRIQVHETLLTGEVDHCLIGSDGVSDLINLREAMLPMKAERVGPLSQFWEDGIYVTNQDAIRRRLAQINAERVEGVRMRGGLLSDDTTLVVVRRNAVSAATEGG
jgi:serine/threonine protein phosphatase PrpC